MLSHIIIYSCLSLYSFPLVLKQTKNEEKSYEWTVFVNPPLSILNCDTITLQLHCIKTLTVLAVPSFRDKHIRSFTHIQTHTHVVYYYYFNDSRRKKGWKVCVYVNLKGKNITLYCHHHSCWLQEKEVYYFNTNTHTQIQEQDSYAIHTHSFLLHSKSTTSAVVWWKKDIPGTRNNR